MSRSQVLPSIIIATRNRPEPLAATLASLARQTVAPGELIVVDASDSDATRRTCLEPQTALPFPVRYFQAGAVSSARQRNQGIDHCRGEIIAFLDDDVSLDPQCLERLTEPFESDLERRIGGVGATIQNELAPPYSRMNRLLLQTILGCRLDNANGRLLGPAVQFVYGDIGEGVHEVEFLSTCACAYRREALLKYRFAESFQGYSFMEDVHLSYRVRRDFVLLQAGAARLVHRGLGSATQKNWVADGESRILNRHFVMTDAMGKSSSSDITRLLVYELVYSPAAGFWNGGSGGMFGRTASQLAGRLRGALKLLCGVSPHIGATAARRTKAEAKL